MLARSTPATNHVALTLMVSSPSRTGPTRQAFFSTPSLAKQGGWRETIPFDEQVASGVAGFLPLNVIIHKSAIEQREVFQWSILALSGKADITFSRICFSRRYSGRSGYPFFRGVFLA